MNNLKKKLSVLAVMFAAMLAFTLIPTTSADAATKNTHKYIGADYIISQGKSLQLPGGSSYTYTSDNTSVATVDANGKVVGKKGGYAVITRKSVYGSSTKIEIGVKSKSYYPNITGKYKVGTDIPAGQYVVIHDTQAKYSGNFPDNFTYWEISKSKNGTYIRNDDFSYISIVTLKKGQYFDFNGGYAVPISKVNKSIFSVKNLNKYAKGGAAVKVGTGFEAGTYTFTLANGKSSGHIYIASKDRGLNLNYKYTKAYLLSKSKKSVTIKLKKGLYIEMEGCTVKKK